MHKLGTAHFLTVAKFHAKSAKIFKSEARKVTLKSHLKRLDMPVKDTKDTLNASEIVSFVALSKFA
jgi:hypothetical protein